MSYQEETQDKIQQKYTDLFLRTWKTPQDNGLERNLYHSLAGMISEMEELEDAVNDKDSVNYKEELGDIYYYFIIYLHYRGIPLRTLKTNIFKVDFSYNMKEPAIASLYTALSGLSNIVKRMCEYQKEPDYKKEEESLATINTCLAYLAGFERVTITYCADLIVEKLKVRYPEKFTNELASNRNLEKERKALEQ